MTAATTPQPPGGDRPLDGVVVVDLTTALAGPWCTQLLGGMGATVVKVEGPDRPDTARGNAPFVGRDGAAVVRRHDDDLSLALLERNRDKLGLALDLKAPEGRAVMEDLLAHAAVLVTNYSRGALARMGLEPAAVVARHPHLVYAAITGFGLDGPPDRDKAMDTIIQALSGLMLTSGATGDGPVRVGVPVADVVAPLYAVIGILGALRRAEATGRGELVDVSMLGAVTSLVATESWAVQAALGLETRTGDVLPRLTPFGTYPTADGHVAICAPTDGLAARLFAAMGIADPQTDPRLATRDARVQHAAEVNTAIAEWTGTRSTAEVLAQLEAHDVPCAPVRTPAEAVVDPAVLARGETTPTVHPRYGQVAGAVGPGMPFPPTGIGHRRPAPALGEHTAQLLHDLLGYDEAHIRRLVDAGVVAVARDDQRGSHAG